MSVSPESPQALPGVPSAAGTDADRRAKVLVGWLAATAALIIVGSIGPWAKVGDITTVSGTEGGDGWLTMVAGGLAVGMAIRAYMKQYGWGAGLACGIVGGLAAIICLIDIGNISNVADTFGGSLIDPGWGIYVALLGSLSLAIGGIVLAVKLRRNG